MKINAEILNTDGTINYIEVPEEEAELYREKVEALDHVSLVWFEGEGPGYDWDSESSCWQRRLF